MNVIAKIEDINCTCYPTKFEGLEIKEMKSGIIAEGPADRIESLINHVLKTNDEENSLFFEGDFCRIGDYFA